MGSYKKKNKNRNKKKQRHHEKSINKNDQSPEDTTELDEEVNGPDPDDDDLRTSKSSKRHFDDDNDSDNDEDKPRKKKKKKKQPVVSEGTENKKGKSIRQMKREKFAQRQAEAQVVAKDHLKGQCLNYLSQWKHDKANWKFMKAKQVWLYKNKFSSNLLPDSSWPLLLEYFESAQGNIRKMLLDDANKVIKQMDDWTETQKEQQPEEDEEGETNENDSETPTNKKPDEHVYKRARDLIQCLEE